MLCFWGGVFFLIPQAERLFLIPDAAAIEWPTAAVLAKTFLAGLLADLFLTLVGLTAAIVLGFCIGLPFSLLKGNSMKPGEPAYDRGLAIGLVLVAVMLLAVSTADMGYYGYNHQHLDFVFFEFLDELFHSTQQAASQAAEQTTAELDDADKWMRRLAAFLIVEALILTIWCVGFIRIVAPRLLQKCKRRSYAMPLVFTTIIATWGTWHSPLGLSLHHLINIESETYASLAQNPVLFAHQPLQDVLFSQWSWTPARLPIPMDIEHALQITQASRGFNPIPFRQYPLVRAHQGFNGVVLSRPANIVLIFVEGLDRRYVGQERTVRNGPDTGAPPVVRLTPFLDHLKNDSVYFEHFFSNGVQTARGLFATLCSGFPRQGTAVIKTRSAHDFLCLPSLLRNAGYRTEMAVSLDSDLPGLRVFLARNGIEQFYGEQDFPAGAPRLGVGLTDGALFDFIRGRIQTLQDERNPFFVATMTSGMHHPFIVPLEHPDVRALAQDGDGYLAALRYFDLEFERFFETLRAQGLLNNTMVLLLGDHGRHEPTGATEIERQGGHFLAPLFMWLDPSLRRAETYRPHTVSQVASQVDVAPTLLAMNGLMPRVAPFMGEDLSCLFITECLQSNRAYLTSVYDDLIGLADQSGIWLFSFRRQRMTHASLGLDHASHISLDEPQAALHYHEMVARYLTTNFLIEQNRIWSWNQLGSEL